LAERLDLVNLNAPAPMKQTIARRDFIKTATAATIASLAVPSILAEEEKKITMAVVGCAHIHTPGFVNLIKSRQDVTAKYVWDHDGARAQKFATELSAKPVIDLKEIWNDNQITALLVCSETNRHHDIVLAAARAGKHMFVEKPLGITGRESFAMARAIEKAKILFTTGYFMRADARHLFLKDEVVKGNFGQITRVRGSNCHSGSLGGWFDSDYRWMADPKLSGVGAFGDLGTHKLDILMWMLGDVDSVTADIKPVTRRYGDCDETGEGLIQFRNGVIATLAAGWVDIEDPVQLLISGTEGHAVIVDNHLFYRSRRVPQSDTKEPWTKLPPAPRAPLHQFLDAVGGAKDQPLVTPREAAQRVRVMEALYAAAKGRKWVNLG
jgi:predicted dehydrogenase